MFDQEDPDYYGIEDEQCSCGRISLKGSQFCRECELEIQKEKERAKEQEIEKCTCPSKEEHSCPFQCDVWDDDDYKCTCCEHCTQECNDDK